MDAKEKYREAGIAGIIGALIGTAMSSSMNYFFSPVPETPLANAFGNGISGFISGVMGGFMGVLAFIKSHFNKS